MFQEFPFCFHQMTTFNSTRVPWVVPSARAVPRSTAAVHGNVDPRHPCVCPCGWRVGTCGCCGDLPKCILNYWYFFWVFLINNWNNLWSVYKAGLPWNTLSIIITVVKAGVGSVLFGYMVQVLRDQIGARNKTSQYLDGAHRGASMPMYVTIPNTDKIQDHAINFLYSSPPRSPILYPFPSLVHFDWAAISIPSK